MRIEQRQPRLRSATDWPDRYLVGYGPPAREVSPSAEFASIRYETEAWLTREVSPYRERDLLNMARLPKKEVSPMSLPPLEGILALTHDKLRVCGLRIIGNVA